VVEILSPVIFTYVMFTLFPITSILTNWEAFHSHLFVSRFILKMERKLIPDQVKTTSKKIMIGSEKNQDQAVYIFEAYLIPSV